MRKMPEKQKGMSLIELMISITVGMALIALVTTTWVQTVRSNGDVVRYARLEEELAAIMSVITRDLRRTGYNPNARNPDLLFTAPGAIWPNKFLVDEVTGERLFNVYDDAGAVVGDGGTGTCVLFAYDMPPVNGNLDANELFGYRFKDDSVQVRQGGTNCTAAGWEALSTVNSVRITNLQFLISKTQVPNPCGIVPTPPYADVYDVTVQLTGQLWTDAAVQRQLSESVRVRSEVVSAAAPVCPP